MSVPSPLRSEPGNPVSIVAECPHCETRFNLQPDLVGKAMRCPNPNCREPFVVREVGQPANAAPAQPAAPPARPGQVSGAVGDLVPVVEAEVVAPAAPPPRPFPPKPPKPPRRAASPDLPVIFDAEPVEEPRVVNAVPVSPATPPKPPKLPEPQPQVVDAVVVAPAPAPKEVVWSAGSDIPPPPTAVPKRKPVKAESAKGEADESVDDLILTRRKKRSNRGPVILIGMIVTILFIGGAGALYVLHHRTEVEAQDAQAAEEVLKGTDYAKAAKTYEKLAADYPDSKEGEKYRFLADLTAMRAAAWSVGNQENPRPALDKLRAFIEAQKSSPYAKPGSDTYGNYVFEAGRKVTEDVTEYAKDRVKAFKAEPSRAKQDELKKAEDMLAAGRDFLPLLSPFRTKDDKTLDQLAEPFEGVKVVIARERRRLDVLDQVRALLKNLSESNIQQAKALLRNEGLADDAEAGGLLAAAEGSFVRMARYERDPAAPQPPPAPAAASLLFVARVGTDKPASRVGLTDAHPPAVFLAVARGILYALDEEHGDLLWAARVGADTFDPPTVAHLQLAEGPTELAVVTSNVAGQPAVSGFVLRTGMARWSQPLPAPAAGPAAVIGARAFVPVRDAAGSVFVFDLTTGMRAGRIVLGQPVGPGAVARSGTNQLYVPAESRRVYVFDVDAGAAGGEPQCVRVIPTEHPTGTLRTPPVILGPAGDAPAPRWLVLAQADGPTAMKLRAFPLPPTPVVSPDAPPVLEPITPLELVIPGWTSFPPVSDGEQLAVVSDQGQFRLFGINQPGNTDKALFPYPQPNLPAPPDGTPVPGLVVPAEEGAFWALVNGSLLKFRLTLNPEQGLTLVPAGTGFPVGLPTQPAQLNPRRDTACFVVRSANSSGCRAVAVRLLDGEPRWQRQLGVIPAAAPARTETGVLVVGEDGGAVAIPSTGVAIPNTATKAAPEWAAAAPVDDVSGPTRVAASADGKTVFTVTPTGSGPTAKWVVRRMTAGKVDHEGSVTAPAALAGQPVVFNGSLLLPAADGSIYRLTLGDGRSRKDHLDRGPTWRLDHRVTNPVCFLLPLTGDAFLASDGGKVLKRWSWPAGGWVDDGMKWEVRQPVAAPPRLLTPAGGKPARLLVADTTGGVWLYGLDRPDPPLRRWVPGKTVALPGGKVSSGFAVQTDPAGRQLAAFAVDGKHLVCLNLDADQPRWVISTGDDPGRAVVGSPHPMGDGRWLLTDLSGRVSVLDADTGRAVVTREVGLPGAVAQTPGVPVGDSRVLVPLSDGSAAVVELQDTGKQAEVKKE